MNTAGLGTASQKMSVEKPGLYVQKINSTKAVSSILTCLFLLLSCVTKQIVQNESFTPHKWKQIAILPFNGNEVFKRVTGELFAYYLHNQAGFAPLYNGYLNN